MNLYPLLYPFFQSPLRIEKFISLRLRLCMCMNIGITIFMLSTNTLSGVGEVTRRFELTSGDAIVTFKQFAMQSGEQILYSSEDVSGVITNAIRGDYIPIVALEQMVRNTPLKARQDRLTRAIAVTRISIPPVPSRAVNPPNIGINPQATNHTKQPTMRTKNILTLLAGWLITTGAIDAQNAATEVTDDSIQLSVFTVSTEKTTGYESHLTTSGTRTVESLKNLANSISVINSQLISDVGALNLEEMSRWFVTGEQSPNASDYGKLVFRGVRNSFSLRDGWIWYAYIDSFSVDRVELLRGPNAFLYGEADLGGSQNIVTKTAQTSRDFQRLRFVTGSNDLFRGEIDINKRINDKMAIRLNAVYHDGKEWYNNGSRKLKGAQMSFTYRPWKRTTLNIWGEHDQSWNTFGYGMYQDYYTNSTPVVYTRPNANTGVTNPAAGYAYVAATGSLYQLDKQYRSTGGSTYATENHGILPKTANYGGPSTSRYITANTFSFALDHAFTEDLNLLISGNYLGQNSRQLLYRGTYGNALLRDLNQFVPNNDGTPSAVPNPYFNELYTEYYRAFADGASIVRDLRASLVYNLDLGWMKQRIVANAQQHQDNPGQWCREVAEFVDPATGAWPGFSSDATVASYTANRTAARVNPYRVYRRFYVKDGDGSDLTGNIDPIAGKTVFLPNYTQLGTPRGLERRRFYQPSIGVGASGSYFNDRLFTLVGYRQDEFRMTWENLIPDPKLPGWQFVRNPDTPTGSVNYRFHTLNLGGVVHPTKWLGLFYNYAESNRISTGEGNAGFINGKKQGIQSGEGTEVGVRMHFLNDRIGMNLVRYDNKQPNARINPRPPQNVLDEVSANYPAEFLQNGQDLQAIATKGYELELFASPGSWRIMLNAANNDLTTTDRLPQLKYFHEKAREEGKPTALLDSFLLQFPDGVPNAGCTRYQANALVRYNFSAGRYKGLHLGVGYNWRDKTYLGAFDRNQDGIIDNVYSPSYGLLSLMAGYDTKLMGRRVSFGLNVDNSLDKEYYRANSSANATWGAPLSIRLRMTVDL